MAGHTVDITLLLIMVLLQLQRPMIQRVGNQSGFLFCATSMWAMFDQVRAAPHHASRPQKTWLLQVTPGDLPPLSLTDGMPLPASLKALLHRLAFKPLSTWPWFGPLPC